MKTTSIILALSLAAAASAIAEEESADLNSLPPAAQKTARELLGKAKVEEVEPTFENGIHAYEVEFTREGKPMAIVLSRDGKLIQTETRIAPADAPEKIRVAALKSFPDGRLTRVRLVEEAAGAVYYEVTVKAGGKSHTLHLEKSGKIL